MKNTNLILIGAIGLFIILAAAGIYAYSKNNSLTGGINTPSQTGGNVNLPASIKSFTVLNGNFVVKGDNLARVEIWAIQRGQQVLLGTPLITTPGPSGNGDIWSMAVPATAHGATSVFARGFDKSGVAVAKIDLVGQKL